MFLHNCAIPKEFLHQVLYLEYIYICVCVWGGGGGGGGGKEKTDQGGDMGAEY